MTRPGRPACVPEGCLLRRSAVRPPRFTRGGFSDVADHVPRIGGMAAGSTSRPPSRDRAREVPALRCIRVSSGTGRDPRWCTRGVPRPSGRAGKAADIEAQDSTARGDGPPHASIGVARRVGRTSAPGLTSTLEASENASRRYTPRVAGKPLRAGITLGIVSGRWRHGRLRPARGMARSVRRPRIERAPQAAELARVVEQQLAVTGAERHVARVDHIGGLAARGEDALFRVRRCPLLRGPTVRPRGARRSGRPCRGR
jgi:hypothetical protein